MAKGRKIYVRVKKPENGILYVGENFELTIPKNIMSMVDINPGDKVHITVESGRRFSLQKYRPD